MNRPARHGGARRSQTAGFTLIELVISIVILSTSVLTILYLQAKAVDDAAMSIESRKLQRIAQEKLDRVIYGLEEELEGAWELDSRIHWSVTANSMSTAQTEGLAPLVECTITVTKQSTPEKEPVEYRLTSWFFPDLENPILDLIESGDPNAGGF